MSKRLFLSCASREFSDVRDQVTADCRFPDIDVKSHEEVAQFNSGGTTLEKLDDYISCCDAIVHLLGHAAGTQAEQAGIEAILRRHKDFAERMPQVAPLLAADAPWRGSYTQWEAHLALYHRIPCHVFIASEKFERPADFKVAAEDMRFQADHQERLERREQDRRRFDSREELRVQVQRSLRQILPAGTVPFQADISRIIEYAPAELIGREEEMKLLDDAWHGRAELLLRHNEAAQQRRPTKPKVITFVALGGEGKTSLVAKWAAELAAQDWLGCDAAFAWSFYSQGTREQHAASSDLFLKEALNFFAELEPEQKRDEIKAFAASPAGAFEKGQRLARLVGQRRSLLIFDGLEPLQYAPTAPTPGKLKDQGIASLLKGLAAASHGLCIVTTRYSLPDLKVFWQTTAPEAKLERLSREAGVHLLKSFNVRGSDRKNIPFNNGQEMLSEFEKLVEDVKGHALTLNLLGSYLRDAHGGDIRQRDRVQIEEADAEEQGGHAFRVMHAYVEWLERGGKNEEVNKRGKRALAILRLIGLFDRPATADCLGALWNGEPIPNLTEPLVGLNDAQRNLTFTPLEAAKLLTVNRDAAGALVSLDAHPHVREYFAKQLREKNPDSWRTAHRRLYEHLCATTNEGDQPTLEDLQPLYQAVAHGCQARRHQEVMDDIFRTRILRGNEFYSTNILGAFGQDLSALASFFDFAWGQPATGLDVDDAARVLSWAGFRLRALGRINEAREPMSRSLEMLISQQNWKNAAIAASNLSELLLLLGSITEATESARRAVSLADRSDAFLKIGVSVTLADTLYQSGQCIEAVRLFANAQAGLRSITEFRFLFGAQGQKYCELLLAQPERVAWQVTPSFQSNRLVYAQCRSSEPQISAADLLISCQSVSTAVALTLNWQSKQSALDTALAHLILGRSSLYCAIIESRARQRNPSSATPYLETERSQNEFVLAHNRLDFAVTSLRQLGTQHHLPRALLARAWLRRFNTAQTGHESAQEYLDEAWDIAERGPMRLHLADIHLYRARLFFREKEYPWRSPQDDLAAAEKLINECGYHRRDEELADAKRVILELR